MNGWTNLGRLSAFTRRDLQVKLSYRTGLLGDVVGLVLQSVLFYFVGKLVAPDAVPAAGPNPYISFVAIGIAVGVVIQLGLLNVSAALQREQVLGTLEAVMATPTPQFIVQVGGVGYDLIYLPLRTAVFLAFVAVVYQVPIDLGGVLPALALLLALLPLMWGLGVAVAALVMTFKRGDGTLGILATLVTMASGAYFPLDLLPDGLRQAAQANPVAQAMSAIRGVLVMGDGWQTTLVPLVAVLASGAVTLAAGLSLFRWAVRRERRRGTMAIY